MGRFQLRGDYIMAASDFRLIRPVTITDAIVTSNSVAEADATEWTSGTRVIGDLRMVTTTANGASVATHYIYQANTTTGADPTLVANQGTGNGWDIVGATNAWKMFDPEYQTQTTNTDTIVVDIAPVVGVNAVALLNLDAASVTVSQTTTGYTSTQNLVSQEVLNWYDFFFELPTRRADAVFTDIPPFAGKTLTVTIDSTGSTAKCGTLVVGTQKVLGATQWEANRSINDYSTAAEAADGVVTLTQGGYSKRLNMEFNVPVGFESEATRILEEYRATPMVFVGSEDYAMTIIYGFLGSWAVPISNTGRNAFVEIKGLI